MIELWMLWMALGLLALLVLLAISLLCHAGGANRRVERRLDRLEQDLEHDRAWLRDELGRARQESIRTAKDNRDELARTLRDFGDAQSQRLSVVRSKEWPVFLIFQK